MEPTGNNNTLPPTGTTTYPTISSDGGQQYGTQINNQLGQYTVQPGDTLSGIGLQFGVPWQTIYNLNQGTIGSNPNMIIPGQVLSLGGPQNTGSLQNTMSGTNTGPAMFTGTQPPPSGGSVLPPTTEGQPPTAPQQNLAGVPQFQYTAEQQQYLNSFNNYQNQLMSLSSMVDQNYNAELAEINAEMNNLKLAQQKENDAFASGMRQAGLVSGLSQFTPEIMKGNVKMAVDQGIAKLTELSVKQRSMLREAQDANLTRKVSILKELRSLDSEKYQTARQMKQDFFDNLKQQRELERETVAENLPAIYDELRSLPQEQRDARILQYAQQLDIPASRLQSYYRQYDKEENKVITDMRAQIAAQAFDVAFNYDDIYNSTPQQFMKKLMSSKVIKNSLLSQSLDNMLKQAQVSKLIADVGALGNTQASFQALPSSIQNAASVILGSSRLTAKEKESFLETLSADPIVAKQAILNKAKNLLSGNNQTDLENRAQAVASIKSIQSALNSFYENGGSSSLLKGRYEKVVERLGSVSDPKLAAIAASVATALQQYRNAVTGTAYSVQEGRDIAAIFPGIDKGRVLNNILVKNRLNSLQTDIDSLYSSILGADTYREW